MAGTRAWRGPTIVVPVVLFVAMFGWSLVQVGLPFYVQEITHDGPAVTLRWIGVILGVTPLLTIATTPVWMRLGRAHPVHGYVLTQALQGLGFMLMAASHDVGRLLACRIFLGLSGPPTAFAFLVAAHTGRSPAVSTASTMQSAVMLGTIIGPLAAGAVIATAGYLGSFVLGGALLWGCSALVAWTCRPAASRAAHQPPRPATRPRRGVAVLCVLSLVVYTQLFFLGPVLPVMLPALGVAPGEEIHTAGVLLFGSGLSLAGGAWAASALASRLGEARTLHLSVASASLCLGALAVSPTLVSFAVLRFVQSFLLGPVPPLVLARVLASGNEQAVGWINSARFGAGFVGPVVATTLMSWSSPALVFGVLAVAGLLGIPAVILTGALDTREA